MVIDIEITIEENQITLEAWPTEEGPEGRTVIMNAGGWLSLEQWSVETDTETLWSIDWDPTERTLSQMSAYIEGAIDVLTNEEPPGYNTVREFLGHAREVAESRQF